MRTVTERCGGSRQARKVGAEFGKDDTESRGTAGEAEVERKGMV